VKIRPFRALGAILALFSMLFMQLAVAGYVCPSSTTGSLVGEVVASAAMVGMPDCDHPDAVQPTLCHASAHAVHQSLDKHEPPTVQPFVPASIVHVLLYAAVPVSPDRFELNTAHPSGASPPSLAIRHCCFRI
jgi:hypothetical protein